MAFEFDNNVKGEIRRRQRGFCAFCGNQGLANFHHVVPRQSGNPMDPQQAWLGTAENGVGLCLFDHHAMHIGSDELFKIQFGTGAVPPASYFAYAHGKPPNSDATAQAAWEKTHASKAAIVWADLQRRFSNKVAIAEDIRKALFKEAANNAEAIRRQVNLGRGEHSEQMKLITTVDTSSLGGLANTATGMLGYATSEFFNKVPPLTIWIKAETALSSARMSIKDGNLMRASADIIDARFEMMLAMAKYTRWKDALFGTKDSMGAGSKMMIAIGVSAIALVAVTFTAMAAAPVVIEFFAGLAEVAPSASSSATPMIRLAATVTAAEQRFRIAEVAIEELEREVEVVEAATRQMRL